MGMKLKRGFDPLLQQYCLTWEDLQPALELVDSRAELEDAKSDPQAFFQKLLKQGGPAMEKIKQKLKGNACIKGYEVGTSFIGEENVAMAKESFEMVQKMKEGKVSAKDM